MPSGQRCVIDAPSTWLYLVELLPSRAPVPFDNNLAERAIRPAVIIRKNSDGNRSDQGADVQAILMSIFFTLKKRDHNPINTIYNALTTSLKTGQRPPMPATATADG